MANRFRDCVPGTTLSPEQYTQQQAANKPTPVPVAALSKKKPVKKK